MSRDLPATPNIEHLRKQAKDLLNELQRDNPAAQLSDAQHAIAREHGFASWPKLKAHVGAPSPFVGIWSADVERSRRHPANMFQRATIEIAVRGNTVTMHDAFTDENGEVVKGRNVIEVDGRERVSDTGYALVANWVGARRLETVATKDGEPIGAASYEVAPDGSTLTFSSADAEYVVVFDRR
jgi:hypothetical protein